MSDYPILVVAVTAPILLLLGLLLFTGPIDSHALVVPKVVLTAK